MDTRLDCHYCGKELDANVPPESPLRPESDHYISRANGGSDRKENRVWACISCNRRKGSLNGDQFLKIMREELGMNEPRHYSMPDAFMRDNKVPARWRLLGVINGFHLAGLPFYGSNVWLKAKLNCSEQTVVNAVKELETSGEIWCERTRTSRLIHRKSDPSQLESRLKSIGVNDPSQLETNSVSNSVREKDTISPSFEEQEKYDAPDPDYAPRLKSKKEPLPKTNEFVEEWNKYVSLGVMGIKSSPPNPSAKIGVLPVARSTPDVIRATITARNKYSFSDFQHAVKQYAQEVINRKKSKDSDFHEHRWTLYQFLTHKNVLPNYVNK